MDHGLTALDIPDSEQPNELGRRGLSVDHERLKAAAERGDIDMLYTLIREDPYLLDFIERIPFVDTPLHTAAFVGHTHFAREIMMLKPSFARKLNQDGCSPLHLALLNGQTKMVDRLLDADSGLVRVQGKKGKTPFHYAAEQGNIPILKQFLLSCPSSIQDVTNRSETALHIAVESRKFDAFCFLVEWLRMAMDQGALVQEYKTLNKKNDSGDTVLHLAVKTHQAEVVRVLIDNTAELDVKNSDGLTALDILDLGDPQVSNRDQEAMKKTLRHAEAFKPSSFLWWKSSKSSSPPNVSDTSLTNVVSASDASPPSTFGGTLSDLTHELDIALEAQTQGNNVKANPTVAHKLFSKVRYPLERLVIDVTRAKNNLSEDSRNMTLVALVLVATVAFQAVLSPPGGVWQDQGNNNSTATLHNKSSSQMHRPGTVMMGNWRFVFFMLVNSLAISLTANAIMFLVLHDQGEPLGWWYAKTLLATFISLCYLISMETISPNVSLFALVILIAAAVVISMPFIYSGIKRNLEYRIYGSRRLPWFKNIVD